MTLRVNIYIIWIKKILNAQYTVKNVYVFVPLFLYAVTYVVTFFFVLKIPKIWVGRTTLNGEKKGDGLRYNRGNTHGFPEFYARFFAEKQI